jgi:predicted DNA-binding transcriptional regulator YafY
MDRFSRALGILLFLRVRKTVSASELARRFEVSTRTIYRDIAALSAVGVPIYAELGRTGGFRLLDGYFLPPVMLSIGEATSLLTGLAFLARLRAKPFTSELETAAHKLLATLPDHLRATLARAQPLIGFEPIPSDIFHPEPGDPTTLPDERVRRGTASSSSDTIHEANVITTFLSCLFERHAAALTYRSPYRACQEAEVVAPYGVFWDRDRWYLVGRRLDQEEAPRLWRADRVLSIARQPQQIPVPPTFDVTQLLGRMWLTEAMAHWMTNAPTVNRMSRAQAKRLKQDWYYGHARFDDHESDEVVMTFGESDRRIVFALLRWLGPGAELLSPEAWRVAFTTEMRAMLAPYEEAC